ncbi:hypothetical protein NQ318_001771 [Aromia moschata]|uniref:Uncharacterized protein n=1 Tax=Aromia moschata TaxID=1265417 RepID=A0AAV8Y679_9CUCU|nr:hypothetical protein NQ318_001771 [Aromia moschata]
MDLVFRYFCACICLIQKREKIVYMQLQKNPNLRNKVCGIFNVPNQLQENVIQCGEAFVRSLYPDGPKFGDINNLRHHLYNKAMARQSPSALLDLSSLPPTKAACAQHSLRVYFQILTAESEKNDKRVRLGSITPGMVSLTGSGTYTADSSKTFREICPPVRGFLIKPKTTVEIGKKQIVYCVIKGRKKRREGKRICRVGCLYGLLAGASAAYLCGTRMQMVTKKASDVSAKPLRWSPRDEMKS